MKFRPFSVEIKTREEAVFLKTLIRIAENNAGEISNLGESNPLDYREKEIFRKNCYLERQPDFRLNMLSQFNCDGSGLIDEFFTGKTKAPEKIGCRTVNYESGKVWFNSEGAGRNYSLSKDELKAMLEKLEEDE